jgi:hypothetical protein
MHWRILRKAAPGGRSSFNSYETLPEKVSAPAADHRSACRRADGGLDSGRVFQAGCERSASATSAVEVFKAQAAGSDSRTLHRDRRGPRAKRLGFRVGGKFWSDPSTWDSAFRKVSSSCGWMRLTSNSLSRRNRRTSRRLGLNTSPVHCASVPFNMRAKKSWNTEPAIAPVPLLCAEISRYAGFA